MKSKSNIIYVIVLLLFVLVISSVQGEWYPGDLHQHTRESSEQADCHIETSHAGRTVEQLRTEAYALDLNIEGYWMSVTDHSYCLTEGEWNVINNSAETSSDTSFPGILIIAGEEVSASENCGDETTHIGAHGISSFIEQSMAGEKYPASPTAQEAINLINNDEGVSIINHPFIKFDADPIDFDSWDCGVSGENGLEIWNEGSYAGFHSADNDRTYNQWIHELLNNNKIYAYGGTDSHDDIDLSVLNQVFMDSFDTTNLKKALKEGKVTVSNNGLVWIELKQPYNSSWHMQGSTAKVCSQTDALQIETHFNTDHACSLNLYRGDINSGTTYELIWHLTDAIDWGAGTQTITTYKGAYDSYFRAECISSNGNYKIYTNPIWVEIDNAQSDSDGICDSGDCEPNNPYSYPGNSNPYCNCNDGDDYVKTTEILGDAWDNNCDGRNNEGSDGCLNGLTRPCPKQYGVCADSVETCTNGQWPGCDYFAYSSLYQAYETWCDNKDNDCDGGSPDEGCSSLSCEGDDTEEECFVWPRYRTQMRIATSDAETIDEYDVPSICGSSYCPEKYGYGVKYHVDSPNTDYSSCPPDIASRMSDVTKTYLEWEGYDAQPCPNTDLVVYNNNEEDLYAGTTEEKQGITNSGNWDTAIASINKCSSGHTQVDITNNFKSKLPNQETDSIAYAWWPSSSQPRWRMERADSAEINIEYCQPCTDVDGDGQSPVGSSCGTKNDCNDNEDDVFYGSSNSYCDCIGTETQGIGYEICDGKDNNCNGVADEGCDDDYDGYCDSGMTFSGNPPRCPNGGGDCDDTDANKHPNLREDCTDGKDNDCDGKEDCADPDCGTGARCGTCKSCSGGNCTGTPADDYACGTIDCSGWYSQSGTEGADSTEYCYSKEDMTSNRCDSFGVCKAANTANCSVQSNDAYQYSCGTCTYISASSCTGTTLGSCSYYGTSDICDSDYLCSSSSGGNNAYGASDYKVPSQAYCDGSGGCDYSSSSPVCTNAEGTGEGSSITSICTDGYSSCKNSCLDEVDNDGDGKTDCADTDCVSVLECQTVFIVQNTTGGNVSKSDYLGNMILKGNCTSTGACTPTSNSFIIRNATDGTVAYINETGDMCISVGTCAGGSASCNPSNDAFIIQDSSGKNVSYIDKTGDLCLIGTLTQKGSP